MTTNMVLLMSLCLVSRFMINIIEFYFKSSLCGEKPDLAKNGIQLGTPEFDLSHCTKS